MQVARMKISLFLLLAAAIAGLVAYGLSTKGGDAPMTAKDLYSTLILLTEKDGGKTPTRDMVYDIKESLEKKGKHIVIVHVEKGNPKFESLCERYAIRSFPSVVVIGRACGETAIVIQDGLERTSLLEAIARASDKNAPCPWPSGAARK